MSLENFPTRETARDMMSMISPVYDRSYVGKWIFEVMSVPLALAQKTVDDLRKEAFPETATWTIPLWEDAYGIKPNESLSLEERRKALTRKRNYRKPMNPHRIAQLVTEVCGRPAQVVENVAPHTYEIRIGPGSSETDIQAVIDTIYAVKQSQKHVRIVFETAVGIRIRAEPKSNIFPYRIAGTHPDVNIVGNLDAVRVDVSIKNDTVAFPYVPAGAAVAGTVPDINTKGVIEIPGINAHVAGESTGIVYKICGAKRLH